jgi:hypothetical protein
MKKWKICDKFSEISHGKLICADSKVTFHSNPHFIEKSMTFMHSFNYFEEIISYLKEFKLTIRTNPEHKIL